jgi:hypothetical protein
MKSNQIHTRFRNLSIAAFVLASPMFAFAQATPNFTATGATTIGGMAQNGSQALSGLYGLAMNAALVLGVFLSLLGLWLLYQNKKDDGRTKASHGIVALVIGALMIFLPSVIEGVGATAFGGGPAVQAQSTMH